MKFTVHLTISSVIFACGISFGEGKQFQNLELPKKARDNFSRSIASFPTKEPSAIPSHTAVPISKYERPAAAAPLTLLRPKRVNIGASAVTQGRRDLASVAPPSPALGGSSVVVQVLNTNRACPGCDELQSELGASLEGSPVLYQIGKLNVGEFFPRVDIWTKDSRGLQTFFTTVRSNEKSRATREAIQAAVAEAKRNLK